MTTRILACAVLSAGVVIGTGASAQDLTIKAPPQARAIVIENATLHIGDGTVIEGGTIWFEGGRIAGVQRQGLAAAVLPDAERIDGRGLHVYPGLIGANTTIGLNEIGSVRATQDYDEVGDLTPEVRAAVAINPDSTAIPVTRSNGVLTVGVLPSGGLLPGRVAVVQLEGWTWEEMAVLVDAGQVVDWPALPSGSDASRRRGRRRGPGRPGAAPVGEPDGAERAIERARERRAEIERAFADAKAYLAARAADGAVPEDIRFEALGPVLRGEKPVFVRADQAEQIRSALTWAIGQGLRPVVVGGRDAAECVELLREHAVPVVLTGTHRLPTRRDSPVDEPFTLPSRLQQAGIAWCLATTGGFANERNLPYEAATAVAHGLPVDAALRAVTLSAAEILGVGDRLGSLDKGKLATLLLTDGNPLETTARVHAAFVSGRRIDLRNKQTELARKYRAKYRQMGLLPPAGERGGDARK